MPQDSFSMIDDERIKDDEFSYPWSDCPCCNVQMYDMSELREFLLCKTLGILGIMTAQKYNDDNWF